MTRDVTKEIHAALRTVAPEIDPAAIDPGAVLVETRDIDSMDFLSFLEALAARVGVDFPEVDCPRRRTVADIAAYIDAHAPAGGTTDQRARL
jgi:acyl carrier protein